MMTSRVPTPPGVLDAQRARPSLMLALVGVEAMRRLRSALDTLELTPRQFQILGLLHDHGPTGQGDLVAEMGVAPSVLVTLLNPLEAAALISRRRDEADRRRHVVALTESGRAQLTAAFAAQLEAEDELFGVLSTAQREQLGNLLALIRDGATRPGGALGSTAALERLAMDTSDEVRR